MRSTKQIENLKQKYLGKYTAEQMAEMIAKYDIDRAPKNHMVIYDFLHEKISTLNQNFQENINIQLAEMLINNGEKPVKIQIQYLARACERCEGSMWEYNEAYPDEQSCQDIYKCPLTHSFISYMVFVPSIEIAKKTFTAITINGEKIEIDCLLEAKIVDTGEILYSRKITKNEKLAVDQE